MTNETQRAECKPSDEAVDWAESELCKDNDALWNASDKTLLGALKSYEFRGSLWSDYGFDWYRHLMAIGYDAGAAHERAGAEGS